MACGTRLLEDVDLLHPFEQRRKILLLAKEAAQTLEKKRVKYVHARAIRLEQPGQQLCEVCWLSWWGPAQVLDVEVDERIVEE